MYTKNIFVTGDIILDHHLYQGHRLSPDSDKSTGTLQTTTHGGAALVVDLLEELRKQRAQQPVNNNGEEKTKLDVQFGLNRETLIKKLPPSQHGFAVWKPYDLDSKNDAKVWRVSQPMGYGTVPEHAFSYNDYAIETASPKPDIVVIDDGGIGFRSQTQKHVWPAAIREENPANPPWVVLKMSNPVGQGDLWRHLSQHYREKLIVLVPIRDVRREQAKISKGISWERSALELATELQQNFNVQSLLNCRHLIVTFASAGALHVSIEAGKPHFELIYDPAHLEWEWSKELDGGAFGFMSCLTVGVVQTLVDAKDESKGIDLNFGIKAGLNGMRTLHKLGHGPVNGNQPALPLADIAETINQPDKTYYTVDLPVLKNPEKVHHCSWSIMTAPFSDHTDNPQPLYGIAKRVALNGPAVLANIPCGKFGHLYTADRFEIEKLRGIRQLIEDYEKRGTAKKPLSIGVFGPPGSGKSFGIKQIAKGILGKGVPILEFNLSQFSGPDDLIGAFHQVRDKVLTGQTPVVFWDEFDSQEYRWLQYLLAPMQDGTFQEGQLTHPIGKCIFIFAGGTSYDMKNFGPAKDDMDETKKFKLKKGPDFASRLSGYLNVMGPNRRQLFDNSAKDWFDDEMDICFPIRRALLIRAMLKLKPGQPLKIDRGVLTALIEIERYSHGARSLEKILEQLNQPEDDTIRRSNIPAMEIMELHANYSEFIQLSNRGREFKGNADFLAPFIHSYYRKIGREEGWIKPDTDKPFDALSEALKEDNRQAAVRIPEVLELAGLTLEPVDAANAKSDPEVKNTIQEHLELLAEAEHDGWMQQKLRNGWKYGTPRDNKKKIHHCLVLYAYLSEEEKDKDRNSVLAYPEIVSKAGYRIVEQAR